ncbi:MAG: GTP-binding protein [Actinomycetota bacterium]|nr:GTP-binding protein [Actinomycetota bacterium]
MTARHEMGIALTVVGGFLGAGKTTLLNRLLRSADGRRLALMVNDFGAINIDADLIESQQGEMISLTNGCICCGLSGEFMFALAGLRDREDPPEHVIVEASGVGDTNAILAYGDMPGFAADAALVVADAETVRFRGQDADAAGPQITGQLRCADLVVLNKTDLVTPDELAATRAWVREIVGPSTAIVDAAFGDVPSDVLLGARETTRPPVPATAAARRDHCHEHAHPDYETWSWEGQLAVHGAGLVEAIRGLPEGILRGKGSLHLREDPGNRYVLQLVGRRYTIKCDRPWDNAGPSSRLVLIGLPGSIHAEELDATLARLAAPSDAAAKRV